MAQILKILFIIIVVLAIHFCMIYFVQNHDNHSSNNTMKLIIDTDAGSDDAVALLLVLALADKVDVLAITCTYGNANETNVETNVLKILTTAARSDIPVYAGAEKPLIQNYTAGDYFGKDGLGDFEFGRDIIGKVDKSKHAAMVMIDLVKQYPGQVSILTLGPLTNLALAMKLHKDLTKQVKRIYVMGSAINEDESKNPEIEFNFSLDPEANAIFLNSIGNLTSLVVPWNLVQKNAISKEWRKEVLGKLDSERIKFLNQAEYEILERVGVWYSADSITMAMIIWPELIELSIEAHMSSVTCGLHNGTVKLDYEYPKNVEIVREFDVEGFKKKLLKHLA